jgi:hypothetical protein
MRVRIKAMRQLLEGKLKAAGVKQDMSFITRQIGMFSYSGLSKDQMVRLRSEFGVYGVDTGRICVAALNSKNIDHVVASIAGAVQAMMKALLFVNAALHNKRSCRSARIQRPSIQSGPWMTRRRPTGVAPPCCISSTRPSAP